MEKKPKIRTINATRRWKKKDGADYPSKELTTTEKEKPVLLVAKYPGGLFFLILPDSKNFFVLCWTVGSVRSESVLTGMPEDEAFIQNLPTEVLEYILGLVSPYSDLQSCKLVCKRWLEIVQGIQCRPWLFFSSSLQSRFLLKHYRCGQQASNEVSLKSQRKQHSLGNPTVHPGPFHNDIKTLLTCCLLLWYWVSLKIKKNFTLICLQFPAQIITCMYLEGAHQPILHSMTCGNWISQQEVGWGHFLQDPILHPKLVQL